MDAYRYALTQVDLFGPTNFSSFLLRAIEMAGGKVTQETQTYNILLVITVSLEDETVMKEKLYFYCFKGWCDIGYEQDD